MHLSQPGQTQTVLAQNDYTQDPWPLEVLPEPVDKPVKRNCFLVAWPPSIMKSVSWKIIPTQLYMWQHWDTSWRSKLYSHPQQTGTRLSVQSVQAQDLNHKPPIQGRQLNHKAFKTVYQTQHEIHNSPQHLMSMLLSSDMVVLSCPRFSILMSGPCM